jgi:hypothetical protein
MELMSSFLDSKTCMKRGITLQCANWGGKNAPSWQIMHGMLFSEREKTTRIAGNLGTIIIIAYHLRRVRLDYQPPAGSTFLSEQTSNQPAVLFSRNKSAPASRFFLKKKL